ncbi:MAG: NAD(P)-dependent oxidoreductase [Saprospiraceae bacterium]|nr:MAG: NAD(P)-dependent oxidoreductase [Saprospiraceae bacterium]
MKKILVTGASGFVGSFLVEECLRRNLQVYAGVRKTSSRKYLQDERTRFLEMDFSDKNLLKEQMQRERFDYIIHNAGVVSAPKLEDYWRVNFEYPKNLTEALAGCAPAKFTFISSLAAYGPASSEDLTDFLKEEDTPKPINTYGKSKLATEQHLAGLQDLPYIIIRPAGVYGPREQEIFTFFKLLDRHMEGYIGFRRQHLTFIYVKDLARVVVDATLSQHTHKAYFVSDGQYYSQWDLGKVAKDIIKKPTLRFHVPLTLVRAVAWLMERMGKGDGKYPALNLEKVRILESLNWKCDLQPLKEDMNFKPEYTLEQGIAEAIQWYKKEGWM